MKNRILPHPRTRWFLPLLAMLLAACHRPKVIRIGVSQCSQDEWREKQNAEMKREISFYDNAELEIRSVKDDNEKQIADIRHFIETGVDLIIVSPNEARQITPVVEEAFERGIPVVTIDRKILSDKFTAFVGADNYDIGVTAGKYLALRCNDFQQPPRVFGLGGLPGSTASIERSEGFASVFRDSTAEGGLKGIRLVGKADADWNMEKAERIMDSVFAARTDIDVVAAMNDRMAIGALRAMRKHDLKKHIIYIGVDALTTEGMGVEQVLQGNMDATVIYPTGGDKVIDTAMRILSGRPCKRETLLPSALVDRSNARIMMLQDEQIRSKMADIERLDNRLADYLKRFGTQRLLLVLCVACAGLLAAACFVVLRANQMKTKHNRLLQKRNEGIGRQRNLLAEQKKELEQQRDQLAEQRNQLMVVSEEFESAVNAPEKSFINRFRDLLNEKMADPDLSVEDLGAEMGLSRVQLYRKLKALTNASPVELLRTTRLKRAHHLLTSTDHTVAEVAYKVGFSSPSYFSKCYKEYFGKLPGEEK